MDTPAAALALWTAGKTPARLVGDARPSGTDLCFVNQRADGLKLSETSLQHAVFSNVSFLDGELTKVDFSHSTFYRCYFRRTKLRGCNFTGCRFVECEFPDADILNCQFPYSKWDRTDIDAQVMISNLPEWPNVAHSLLVALRTNALNKGDGVAARELLFAAMALSRKHHYRIAFAEGKYYKDKYNGWRRLGAFFQWLGFWAEKALWGYGENPGWVAGTGGLSIVLFALYYLWESPATFGASEGLTWDAVSDVLLYSVRAFTSASPPPALSFEVFPVATTLQAAFGLVFVSVLAAVIYRWLTVRSF